MTTVLETAYLANRIYHNQNWLHLPAKIDNWYIHHRHNPSHWYACPLVDPDMNAQHLCYCQLFIKYIAKKPIAAVLSIRGTDSLTGYFHDYKSWRADVLQQGQHDNLPEPYFNKALAYFQKAYQYLRQNYPRLLHHLCFTGHSLGGSVAKLLVTQAQLPYPVTAFNAPGIGHMQHNHINADFILNINARYGFINKIGEDVGKVILINITQQQLEAQEFFKLFENHDKKRFFNSNNISAKKAAIEDALTRMQTADTGANKKPWSSWHKVYLLYKMMRAQHAMLNMLAALHQPSNHAVASLSLDQGQLVN